MLEQTRLNTRQISAKFFSAHLFSAHLFAAGQAHLWSCG